MNCKRLFLACFLLLSISSFAQQPDLSMIPYRKGNLWGYASPDKRILVVPVYDETSFFYEGYASVKKGARYGYIGKRGKMVIPFQFYSAKHFRYGYTDNLKANRPDTVLFAGAVLTPGGIERCIDTHGRQMSKCPAINEENAPINQLPLIADSAVSSFSTLNKSETFDKVTGQYRMGGDETYYIAVKNDLYGVINTKFDKIIPFEYTSITKLVVNDDIYLLAEKNGLKGVFSRSGSPLLNMEYSRLEQLKASDGKDYFILSKNGNTGLKDAKLRDLVSNSYADIQYDNAGGFILTGMDKLKGCWFLNNKVVEPKFAEVRFIFQGRFAMIKTGSGKTGYINNAGVEFFED